MNKKTNLLLGFIIFITSFSVLSIEVIYSRIFSVLTFYHFSSMIISIALLGFGAAGSYMSLKYSEKDNVDKFLTRNVFYLAVSNIFVFYLIIKIRFYPLMLVNDWTNQVSLLFYYFFLSIPFFFAGRILTFVFTKYSNDIGVLYFFDLFGGSLGSLSVFLFLGYFTAPEIVHLVSIVLLLTLIFYLIFNKKKISIVFFIFLLSVFYIFYDISKTGKMLVYPPPSKEEFNWAPPWKGKKDIEYSKWNLIERLDITRSFKRKTWDFGGDISSKFINNDMELRYMFKDGIASTGILKVDKSIKEYKFLGGYLQSSPYKLRKYESVVSIGFGGGIDLWIAKYHHVRRIIGVEINPLKVEVLKSVFREYSGNIAKKTILVPMEGRHFLSIFQKKVDVIQMSGLDSYPALSSGAFAMSENYVFTKEGIIQMLNHLNKNGVISINRIIFNPPRETLRMVSTMIAALSDLGVKDVRKNFLIIRGNRWANILLKRENFVSKEVENIRNFAKEMGFYIIYDPFCSGKEENEFYKLIKLSPEGRKRFYKKYMYRIEPATDNSPFFFQYYKWSNLLKQKSKKWAYSMLMPIGLKIIIYSIIQIAILGLFFIIYPIRKIKVDFFSSYVIKILLYFSLIGFGFILTEIVLIQKLMVFLGGPLYSLSVTLFSILLFSGLGSLFSKKIVKNSNKKIIMAFGFLLFIAAFYIFFFSAILNNLLYLKTVQRIILSFLLLGPISFLMGFPFPTAIRFVSEKHKKLIPWAWAINSVSTVLGSVLCLFLSISFGFSFTWGIAVVMYLFAAIIFIQYKKEINV